jgi:hypothetical protein
MKLGESIMNNQKKIMLIIWYVTGPTSQFWVAMGFGNFFRISRAPPASP